MEKNKVLGMVSMVAAFATLAYLTLNSSICDVAGPCIDFSENHFGVAALLLVEAAGMAAALFAAWRN